MKLIFCLRIMLLSCLLSVFFLSCGTDNEQAVTAKPIFSLSSGKYSEGTVVVLSSTSPGAVIYYSTNGTVPNPANSPVYNSPLVLMTNTSLQAIAQVSGWLPSAVVSNSYIITRTVAAPTLLPAAGTYTQSTNLIFNCLTTDAKLEYSTNAGSDWYAGTNLFVDRSTIVWVRGKKDGYTNSAIVSAQYILQVQSAIFSKSNSSFLSPFNLELNCPTLDATIYYSTNGGSSWIVGSTLAISNSCVVQVKAQKAGWQDSQVVQHNYKIKQYGWVQTSTAVDVVTPNASCLDSNGNLYMAGQCSDSVDFDFGTGVDTHDSGMMGQFITKRSSSGDYCWTRVLRGTNSITINAICADENGNVYVTGRFYGSIDFNRYGGGDTQNSHGNQDIFITQFKSDGSYGWTKVVGGSDFDSGNAVACTPSGDLLVAGRFTEVVDFDTGAGQAMRTNYGGSAAFLSRYNSAGVHIWTKTATVSSSGKVCEPQPQALVVDSSGNIFLGGVYSGVTDFHWEGVANTRTATGSLDIWVSRFDSSGQPQWTKTFGGSDIDVASSLALDQTGNIYISGSFAGSVDFDPGVTSVVKTANGFGDMFVLKLTCSGVFCWVKTFGGSSNERVKSLLHDGQDTLYVASYFEGTVDFDTDASVDNRSAVGLGDCFLLSLSSDGKYLGVVTFGGSGFDTINTISMASDGALFLGGHFQNSVDFNFGSGIDSRTAVGPFDMFIMKIMP